MVSGPVIAIVVLTILVVAAAAALALVIISQNKKEEPGGDNEDLEVANSNIIGGAVQSNDNGDMFNPGTVILPEPSFVPLP